MRGRWQPASRTGVDTGVDTAVAVVGGGPVGTLLARELALLRIDVTVLEKLPEPDGISKAGTLHARTAQTLDRRGLLEAVQPGRYVASRDTGRPVRFHFASIFELDLSRVVERKLSGIRFLGDGPTVAALMGEVRLLDPAGAPAGWQRTPRGWTLLWVNPYGLSRVCTYDYRGPHPDRHTPATLAGLLHQGRPLLLDLTGDAGLRAATGPWADRVDIVTATPAGDGWRAEAFLVRPDGYAVWSARGDSHDADTLRAALTRWFGPETW